MTFVGRQRELALLHAQLAAVRAGSGSPPGRAIIVAGRRRAGKSRLVQEFCETSGVASVVFQATHNRTSHAEMADFVDAIATSGLPEASLVAGLKPQDWNQALRTLAGQLPTDRPTIVVIDEVPWLTAGDKSFEGALQTVWDQHLGRKPVLLLLIGSDQSVMEGLTDHDRPFFGRAAPLRVDPLTPAEVQDLTELPPAAAIDAWLITGGFPVIATSWEPGETRRSFLARALADPLSPLLVSGELTLLGEFPRSTLARAVLEAIGAGERTFSLIARAAGGGQALPSGSLIPVLATLAGRRVVTDELPLSTVADTRNRRYRVADSYLRFWLAFGARIVPLAERGLGGTAVARVEAGWLSWRGRAVEPLVRESLTRLLARESADRVVGGWWNRLNNPEVDLVGADRGPVARRIEFVGSVKWRDSQPFDGHDLAELARGARAVPGAERADLVAVSASGFADGLALARRWGPADLLDAWR